MFWRYSVFNLELRKILAYRADFWLTFVGQVLIQYFIASSLWESLFHFQNTNHIRGYDLRTISLFYLIVPIGNRILSGESIGFISREIYDGTFSKYLIYPVSLFQYKSTTYLTHSFFYLVQLSIVLITYSFFKNFYINNLFLGLGIFFLAAVTYFYMSCCIELISLWADNIWSLMLILRFVVSFLGGGYLPLAFFPDWSISILKFTPFPYLINFPIQIFLQEIAFNEILSGIIILIFWIIFFMIILKFIWAKGQKNYSGVGI